MLVSCLGDIMLDVIVDVPGGLVPDDDTPAHITFSAGGQAANVAAWVQALGGRARLFGPRAETGPGRLVDESLQAAGIEVHGPLTGLAGTVMSLVASGYRSLASDPGSSDWLDAVVPGPWLDGADWLFVSGYALLRAPDPKPILQVAATAREAGTRVAVDLSSGAMITAYGAARFRELWQALRPSVVFANEHEWAATNAVPTGADDGTGAGAAARPGAAAPPGAAAGPGAAVPPGAVAGPGAAAGLAAAAGPGAAAGGLDGVAGERVSGFGAGGTAVLVLKQGAAGCTFVIDGVGDHRAPVPGPVRDVTGAGDALAAGFLMGRADLAMESAARCIAAVGAQPHTVLQQDTP
ncbi:carbohydrate kinase family protein [Nocardioides sp. WL0053]|uniref:Carbohydrate kinase family protein n=1 Tax=Nocardioides jiangsuensis TaxID=2866161 RepID=A0ABS7RNT8_9ACTN|nr:carbohydrate kinase family protein [Nocardioides jiangsuensis]MBY9076119.1 carbohydrate kinase family protein [Nocardioides jiangsuensis]